MRFRQISPKMEMDESLHLQQGSPTPENQLASKLDCNVKFSDIKPGWMATH